MGYHLVVGTIFFFIADGYGLFDDKKASNSRMNKE
jgi:hypothetical protein